METFDGYYTYGEILDKLELNDICVFEDRFGDKYINYVKQIKKVNSQMYSNKITQINFILSEDTRIEYQVGAYGRKPTCYKGDLFFNLMQIWKLDKDNKSYKLFWEE